MGSAGTMGICLLSLSRLPALHERPEMEWTVSMVGETYSIYHIII